MTTIDKIQFINDLSERVIRDIIEKAPLMPEEWDGHELRRYIADKFDEAAIGLLARGRVRQQRSSKRLAAYRNEVAIRNL